MTILRLADADDLELLLSWANEPSVVQSSFRGRQITREEHKLWFADALKNDRIRIYIGETDLGFPFGQVRFERTSDVVNIDISVCVFFRGRRLGQNMLIAAMNHYKKSFGDCTFLAVVKSNNNASQKLFLSVGYVEHRKEGQSNMMTYIFRTNTNYKGYSNENIQ